MPGVRPRPGDELVAPHAGRHGVDTWAALTQAAHPELRVVGIPDRTALIVHPNGAGTSSALVASQRMRVHAAGLPWRR